MGAIETSHAYMGQEEDPREGFRPESTLRHEWFIDAFTNACSERGITPDLELDTSLVDSLDEWLTKRLSKKIYVGNRCFYDEKPHHFTEKILQIISEWESLKESSLGRRMGVPADPGPHISGNKS